jgi:hypothetical protein
LCVYRCRCCFTTWLASTSMAQYGWSPRPSGSTWCRRFALHAVLCSSYGSWEPGSLMTNKVAFSWRAPPPHTHTHHPPHTLTLTYPPIHLHTTPPHTSPPPPPPSWRLCTYSIFAFHKILSDSPTNCVTGDIIFSDPRAFNATSPCVCRIDVSVGDWGDSCVHISHVAAWCCGPKS